MDDTTSPSSASSSLSDSDACSTDSGLGQTPERKLVANNRSLFPPQLHSLRRSPRLSTPRPQPPNTFSPVDQESAAQEAKDIDLVAELVNEVEFEDDEQMLLGTPPRTEELEQDEPLSALADKILHAVDNPSPPPSPATALKMFDPYHSANVTEYEADLLFPHVPQRPNGYPLIELPDSTDPSILKAAINHDLIVFDFSNQLPFNHVERLNAGQQPMSVDELLADSPDSSLLTSPNRHPTLLINDLKPGEVGLMSVDSTNLLPEQGKIGSDHLSDNQEGQLHDGLDATVLLQRPAVAEDAIMTPLRRSPRKSVASPQPPPVVTAPSVARTSIKKKDGLQNSDGGIINDHHDDERGDGLKSQSRMLPSTPRRSQSPSKEPLSFQRELGSLSPASVSVLSSLAFNSIDIPRQEIDSSSRSTIESLPVLSFSVFAPSGGFDDLGTPVRTDGPKRVPSPLKVEVSPQKFRLQSPRPNDPTSTPARRIPIEQAITEGQLSPEKAAKMGFKATNGGTKPTALSTPARRILISEKHPIPGSKLAMPRLESPVRQLTTHKGSLAAPSRHAIPSLKGKERAVSPAPQSVSSSVTKPDIFPFPIVVPTSTSIEFQARDSVQDFPKAGSSPVKSTLKVTSKIPRITKKPYARKVSERVTSVSSKAKKQADSVQVRNPFLEKILIHVVCCHSTSLPSSTTKRPIRLVETPSIPVSRPKPTVSTSTVLVKRKREQNPSPSKPQVTALRQVPSLTSRRPPASSKTHTEPTPPTGGPIYDTIRIRRVVTPPPEPHTPEPPHQNATVGLPCPPEAVEGNELPPASPMKQDDLEVQQKPEPPSAPAFLSVPTEASPLTSGPAASGLRRTTRLRRTVHSSDSETVPRKPTRRKPATHQFDDVFSGMSITALKALTVTNTEKNQQYLAAKLATEVVRKEGLRPESPAVKIRTIVQRQQDEKERQRAERAKRRARRSGKDNVPTSDVEEASSDVGYSSPTNPIEDVDMETNNHVDGLPKHRRGAGDEEDYETPERPLRDVRARLFDDGLSDRQPDRRVKWDRGLFTAVYLDEVELGSRQNLKENKTLKGILTPASTDLRLDTLGNLLHADTPLTDLVPEDVTVKKFVYDNDVVAAPEPPAPKTTRSKSKRK